MTDCRICQNRTRHKWALPILYDRYRAHYFECTSCGSLQVVDPFWLAESYQEENLPPKTDGDSGRFRRNYSAFCYIAALSAAGAFPESPRILDFGGGSGLLTRMFLDAGYDARSSDLYVTTPYFAPEHYLPDFHAIPDASFDVIVSLEVFEHLTDPLQTGADLVRRLKPGGTLVLSTGIYYPGLHDETWWYLAGMGGQHITFWTKKALQDFAHRFGFASIGFFPDTNGFLIVLSQLPELTLRSNLEHALAILRQRMPTHLFTSLWDGRYAYGFREIIETLPAARVDPVPQGPAPEFGVAVFHGLSDVLAATPIVRQLKADFPGCRITWFTSEQYASILEHNPYLDELVGLPGDPSALDQEVPRLKTERNWTRFLTPQDLGGTTSPDAIDQPERLLPFKPIIRLNEQERQQVEDYLRRLPPGPRILIEADVAEGHSPWTDDFAHTLSEILADLHPVLIFTAPEPPLLDELPHRYPRASWCSLPFRLNAELFNRCDAFVGLGSDLTHLSHSDYCRADLPRIVVQPGGNDVTPQQREVLCTSQAEFEQAVHWLRQTLSPTDTKVTTLTTQIESLRATAGIESALAVAERTLQDGPLEPGLANLIAELKYELGQTDEALQQLKVAVQRWPGHLDLLNNLLVVAWESGQTSVVQDIIGYAPMFAPLHDDLATNLRDIIDLLGMEPPPPTRR